MIDVIWFRLYEFCSNIAFENSNASRFSDMQVQIVPPFYSLGEKRVFKKVMFCAKLGNMF